MKKEMTRKKYTKKWLFCILMSIMLLLCGCNESKKNCEEKVKEESIQEKENIYEKENTQENIKIVEEDNSRNIYGTNYDLEYIKSFIREDVVWGNGALMSISDGKYKLVNEFGEDIGDTYFKSILQLSYYYGNEYHSEKEMDYFMVEAFDEKNVNRYGIYSRTGEEILPCEAGYIEALSDRYVKIIYMTKKTNNESEAICEGAEWNEYYKGYIKIYDLEMRRFVPNIIIKNKYIAEDEEYEIEIAGNIIIVNGTAYDDEGQVIDTEASGYGGLATSFWAKKGIYNKDGQMILGNDVEAEFVGIADCDYYSYEDGKEVVLIDDEKNEIFRQKNVKYVDISDKYIVLHSTDNDMYKVVNHEGEMILGNEPRYMSLIGNYICICEEGEIVAVYYGDTLLTEAPFSVEGNEAVYEKVSDEKFRIIGLDGKSSIEVGKSGMEIAPYLLSVQKDQAPGNVGLLDSTDCSILLELDYESIDYLHGYILVEKENGEYDVYKLIKK